MMIASSALRLAAAGRRLSSSSASLSAAAAAAARPVVRAAAPASASRAAVRSLGGTTAAAAPESDEFAGGHFLRSAALLAAIGGAGCGLVGTGRGDGADCEAFAAAAAAGKKHFDSTMTDRKTLHERCHRIFLNSDLGSDGKLDRTGTFRAIKRMLGEEITVEDLEELYKVFDLSGSGNLNKFEFHKMMKFIFQQRNLLEKDCDIGDIIDEACFDAHEKRKDLLQTIAKDLYIARELLCIQDSNLDPTLDLEGSRAVSLGDYCDERVAVDIDPDFQAAFSPSEMKCLALVSHNGMKPSMRKFVEAHKNLLKKFRLTGTNSTMTMLKEVFKDEPPGTVVYGPKCASGPLGGDAELVGYMVTGQVGGIIFFRDAMDAHVHQVDIDCLCRQTLVHNTPMAETPTSAMMMLNSLRLALEGKGRPELIPSFFFRLQSPTVESYKKGQKKVVDAEKEKVGHDTK